MTQFSENVFTYEPFLNHNGFDSFNFSVFDGFWTSNEATVNIIITPVNDAPELTFIEDISFNEGESFQIQTSAFDVDSENLIFDIQEVFIEGYENTIS